MRGLDEVAAGLLTVFALRATSETWQPPELSQLDDLVRFLGVARGGAGRELWRVAVGPVPLNRFAQGHARRRLWKAKLSHCPGRIKELVSA